MYDLLFEVLWIPVPLIFVLLFFLFRCNFKKPDSASSKVVVISGCSSGIGRELTLLYAKQRAKLVLAARRVELLEELVNECIQSFKSNRDDFLLISCDVSKENECKKLIEQSVQHFGGLDYLIVNAGIGQSFFLEASQNTSNFKTFMDVNFWGSVWPTYYALPYLRERKGRIAVVSSMGGLLPFPRQTLYNASKHALQGFFDSLRTELSGSGVTITILNPGFIKTEMTQGGSIGRDGEKLGDRGKEAAKSMNMMGAQECASLICDSIGRRDRSLLVPTYYKWLSYLKFFFPQLLDKFLVYTYIPKRLREGQVKKTQ